MTRRPKILLVDDDPLMLSMLKKTLARLEFDVTPVNEGAKALNFIKKEELDMIICDVVLPDINGMELLRAAQKMTKVPGVIMMTGFATVEGAVEAMRNGAFNYVKKPFDGETIEHLLNQYFKKNFSCETLKEELSTFNDVKHIVGKSDKIKKMFAVIRQVAHTSSTVLIQGECGTGKELVASAIHDLSSRRDNTFVKMNCAALPDNLVESELFGHEKGAFTGALYKRDGKFAVADKGTILLDEISEMSLHLQAKLLRIIQEREFEPLGSNRCVHTDVRIIATSNRDLKKMVEDGKFREDLFYRLNVVPITIPALRDRKNDIPYLLQHFVRKICKNVGRTIYKIENDVYRTLEDYDWPGNVRQLENTVERAIVTSDEPCLRAEHFNFIENENKVKALNPSNMIGLKWKDAEKLLILETLLHERSNRTKAADRLGINVRTLRNKLKEYKSEIMLDSRYSFLLKNDEDDGPRA